MGLPDRGIKLLVLVSIFWALAIVSVVLRFVSRFVKRQALAFNDYAVIVALVFTSGLAVSNILAVSMGGIGSHLPDVPPQNALMSLQIYIGVWIEQALANTFVRLSFLDLLRRIFKVKKFEYAVWVMMGFTIAYGVACFITFFALCRPFAYNWDPTIPGGECGDRNLPFLLSAIFNFVLDFSMIILPMPVLWHLQMSTSRKWALTAVFATGAVVCAMTLLRINAVVDFDTPQAKMDFTYTVFYDALWSSLEPSLGVVNVCLPLFPPAFKYMTDSPLFTTLLSTFTSSRKASSAGYGSRRKLASSESKSFRRIDESRVTNDSLPLPSVAAPPRSFIPPPAEEGRSWIQVTHDVSLRSDRF